MAQQARATNVGAYHFSANKELFEIQRGNNFDFVVSDSLNNIVAYGNETKTFPKAQELIRLSVSSASDTSVASSTGADCTGAVPQALTDNATDKPKAVMTSLFFI